ncbi:Subtilisin-like protease SBT1 [Arachis hypogaea]|nr:Subtilisin-like protease SBT1 [Arachis hypogaea]
MCAMNVDEGDMIKFYISSTATLKFKGTILGIKPTPVLALFSARESNGLNPEISNQI